jgi:hypothetical protein
VSIQEPDLAGLLENLSPVIRQSPVARGFSVMVRFSPLTLFRQLEMVACEPELSPAGCRIFYLGQDFA